MKKRGIKEVVPLFKVVLWLLSIRLGTLLLCGTLCLSRAFPFIDKFSDMPLDKREQVLNRWSKEKRFILLKLVFVVAKIFCFYTFYSIVSISISISCNSISRCIIKVEEERKRKNEMLILASKCASDS